MNAPEPRLAICVAGDEGDDWIAALRQAMPDARISCWPQVQADATVAAVWKPPQAFIDAHPRLDHVFNLGAGVDAIADLELPPATRLIRLEDAGMGAQMVEYVLHALLRHVRQLDDYEVDRRAGRWQVRPPRRPAQFPVGVMGMGVLGAQVARAVASLGFPVHGWSRRPASMDGIRCHAGASGLGEFLAESRVLVCLLPLTAETRNLLDRQTLGRLRRPGYLINIARGAHVVDDDLLALIADGTLAGACLDVFRVEPLPPDHPFWRCPAITITPHVSAQTLIDESVAQVVAGIRSIGRGEPVRGTVDRQQGY